MNQQQLPRSRDPSPQFPVPVPPPAFIPAGRIVTNLLDRAEDASEHLVEGPPPWEHHLAPAKSWNETLILRFHRNQQERLLDVASLLERDRQCLVWSTDRLLENAAVSVAEGLGLDLRAVKDCIRLGAERNWAILEQSFRRHTTALAHIAS